MTPANNKPPPPDVELNASNHREHVILVTHSFPRFDGDWRSNFIEALAMGYCRNGMRVTVLVPNTAKWERPTKPVQNLHLVTYNYLPMRSWQVFGYGEAMKGDLNVNWLHALMLPFMFIAGAVRLAKLLRKDSAIFMHAHWAIPNTLIALAGKFLARSRTPVFTSFPGSDVTAIIRAKAIGRWLSKIIMRSNYLSCNSTDLKQDLVKSGIPEHLIDFVIYGVDSDTMQFDADARKRTRSSLGYDDNDVLLLCIGRFVAKKGFATAIQAMPVILSHYPNAKLLLIGSGMLEDEYRRLIRTNGIEGAVTILGEIPTSHLKCHYSACDIFLMPSERLPSDGLNVVVVEAMACSRPIVASNAGGNDLVVFNGINGYLHGATDPLDIADKLGPLIEDSRLRNAMGMNSRRLVEERFNWTAIAARLIDRAHQLNN